MRIGPLAVDPPVVLAPMAGVTDAAYRALCRSYGAGLYVSEMVSARALVEGDAGSLRRIAPAPDEPVRSIQLYAVDPPVVAEAVKRLVHDVGIQHVDLNMGCPSPKVTKRGGGAALPVRTRLVGAIVRAAADAAGDVPVTVKMRKGIDDRTLTFHDAARAARDNGAAAVALHARTAEQLYSGQADWAAIGELVEALPDIPVLGNGDIWEASDALAMVSQTGCAGVVVGRGCLGRPWLFRDLADAFAGREVQPAPRLAEVVEVMRRHVRLLVQHKQSEHYGTRDFRKHVGWYLTGYRVGGVRRRALSQLSSIAEADELLGSLEGDEELPAGVVRQPRGHTYGPKPVSLPEGWLATADSVDVPEAGADVWTSGG
ncbi:MAG: tRNA dihydrouridine synthase DusB [Frankiales bacterium]|nr:tRNA dihydrouridine synthase DusB [Frankiales bacterium]